MCICLYLFISMCVCFSRVLLNPYLLKPWNTAQKPTPLAQAKVVPSSGEQGTVAKSQELELCHSRIDTWPLTW